MAFEIYKKGEGMRVRLVAMIGCTCLVLFGAVSLHNFITGSGDFWEFWDTAVFRLDFFEFDITWGKLVSAGVFLLGTWFVFFMVFRKRKLSEFLIETEVELRKVSWPPRHEWWGSSVVVLVSVVLLGVFLVLVDQLMLVLVKWMKLGVTS